MVLGEGPKAWGGVRGIRRGGSVRGAKRGVG